MAPQSSVALADAGQGHGAVWGVQIGQYLTRMLRVFGVIEDGSSDTIGFPVGTSVDSGTAKEQAAHIQQVTRPSVD